MVTIHMFQSSEAVHHVQMWRAMDDLSMIGYYMESMTVDHGECRASYVSSKLSIPF